MSFQKEQNYNAGNVQMDIVKGVASGLALGVFSTIMFLLVSLAATTHYKMSNCYAPHATEPKPGSKTFRRSLNPTESGIDI